MYCPPFCVQSCTKRRTHHKNTKTYGVAPHKNKTMIGFFSPVIVFSLCFRKRYGEDVKWRRIDMRKKTNEEFLNELKEKNVHYNNNDIEILDEYQTTHDKILCHCNICNSDFYRWCYDITLYVFKILIELRTHHKNTKTYGVAPHKNKAIIGIFSPVIVFSLCFRKRIWRRCGMEKTNE